MKIYMEMNGIIYEFISVRSITQLNKIDYWYSRKEPINESVVESYLKENEQ